MNNNNINNNNNNNKNNKNVSSPILNSNNHHVKQQQQQQQSSSPVLSHNSNNSLNGASSSNSNNNNNNKNIEYYEVGSGKIPTIKLNKTPLIKDDIELDFSAKKSKEGIFALWSNALEKKKLTYSAKEMTILIEPPESKDIIINSPILTGSTSSSSTTTTTTTTKLTTQQILKQQDDLSTLFELIHHCIFFSSNNFLIKKDVVSTMNNYFCTIIKESASNVKIIVNTLFEVFGYYLDLARSKLEEEDSKSITGKNYFYLIGSLERFIQDCFNNFRDSNDFQLLTIQKLYINHLNDFIKSCGSSGNNSNNSIYNDNLQKFNFILSISVEQVESIQKSKIIKLAFKLDSYLEKTLYLKCKALLSSREYFLALLKSRKNSIDMNKYYKRGNFEKIENYNQWKKQEESIILKQSQLIQPKEDYMKSVWGIKSINTKNETIGVISIKVVGARDLFQKEANVKPESFVEIELNSSSSIKEIFKKRTKKVVNGSLNPIWKEHFSFQITKQQLNDEIEFTIWDAKSTSSNSNSSSISSSSSSSSSSSLSNTDKFNFLGKCKFTIKELMVYLKREVNWFPLQKRTSRSRVSGDLKLQFNYLPFPEIQNISPDKVLNHLYYLQILLDKLIEFDSINQPSNSNNNNNNNNSDDNSNNNTSSSSSSPMLNNSGSGSGKKGSNNIIKLSNQSNLLLKEYCERYGIMEHTFKLFYMKRLVVNTIKYLSLEYIPEIRSILKNTIEIKFGEIGLTIEEDEILKESVSALSLACKSWLSHFHAVFPMNQPQGSLRMLIDIYYLLKNSEMSILPPLSELIHETYLNRYKQAIIMAQDIGTKSNIVVASIKSSNNNSNNNGNRSSSPILNEQPSQPSQPSQQQSQKSKSSILVKVCDLLLYNLELDQKYFSREFSNDTPILIISIEIYTQQLVREIDELTEKGANNSEELQDFFQLYLKLKETMSKFKEIYPKLVVLSIPILFKQVILQWVLFCAEKLKNVIDNLCLNEKWKPISNNTLHSVSVGEVFLGCYHALDVIKSLRWEDFQKDHKNTEHTLFEIFGNFTMVVSESVIYYTKVIRDISLNALDEAADDIFKLAESHSPSLEQTIQKVSLRFNNIQGCIGHVEDLIQVLLRIMSSYKLSPSIVNEMANHTYIAISNNVRTLVDRIYDRLSPVIQGEIYKLLEIDLGDKNKNVVVDFFQKIEKNFDRERLPINIRLEPLLNYIASKLQLFSKHLYYPLTKQLLKRCWGGIINAMDEIIFPSNKKLVLSMNQLDRIESMIKIFGEFFYVDGEGLTQKAIDKQSERFIIIVTAYREAINSGVNDFDPLGLKNALKNINFSNLKPDLTYLKKLNINLKEIPKQLDVFSLIKKSVEKKQEEKKKRDELRKQRKLNSSIGFINENQQSQKFDSPTTNTQ